MNIYNSINLSINIQRTFIISRMNLESAIMQMGNESIRILLTRSLICVFIQLNLDHLLIDENRFPSGYKHFIDMRL